MMNTYLLAGELLGVAGATFVGWKYILPYWKIKKFKKSPYYQEMVKINQEHQKSLMQVNCECSRIKSNKIIISDSISAEEFTLMEKRNYFDDDVSKQFFLEIIVKHIKRKPECYRNFWNC